MQNNSNTPHDAHNTQHINISPIPTRHHPHRHKTTMTPKRPATNSKTKANANMTNQIIETQTTNSRSRFQKTSPRLQHEKEIRKLNEQDKRTQVTFDVAAADKPDDETPNPFFQSDFSLDKESERV